MNNKKVNNNYRGCRMFCSIVPLDERTRKITGPSVCLTNLNLEFEIATSFWSTRFRDRMRKTKMYLIISCDDGEFFYLFFVFEELPNWNGGTVRLLRLTH
jgi:hypothetical protein